MDDHGEGRLAADLRPAPLQEAQRAGIAEHDDGVVFRGKIRFAQVRRDGGDLQRSPEEPAAQQRSVSAVVAEGAAAVARGIVEPVAELRRASVLTRAGVAAR
jgi:hypothetical protein